MHRAAHTRRVRKANRRVVKDEPKKQSSLERLRAMAEEAPEEKGKAKAHSELGCKWLKHMLDIRFWTCLPGFCDMSFIQRLMGPSNVVFDGVFLNIN